MKKMCDLPLVDRLVSTGEVLDCHICIKPFRALKRSHNNLPLCRSNIQFPF